jgi:iron-sulfur cluster assembly protein
VLSLTETAAIAILDMLEEAELPPEGGMRITAEQDGESGEPGLHLSFAAEPEDGDETITEHGAKVFLDPSAAEALEDKLLDAELHGDHAHFSVS